MERILDRRTFLASSALAAAALLGACARGESPSENGSAGTLPLLKVGTLATEDLLPLWVAQDSGLFAERGLDVDIVCFQSATELIAGVSAGEVNLAMTDIMVSASIFASGIDLSMLWVTLGTAPEQGRFGIMVGPESPYQSLAELSGVPIGVGSNTILEYVMDCLLLEAGVPEESIVVEELQKLPVRYQTMVEGNVAAAALPGTLLALGEASGCRTIADDTTGENLSQSVMVARRAFLEDDACASAVAALEEIWNEAAKMVNDDPEAYRSVLVQNASLPEQIAETYPISTYPAAQLPTAEMVDPVLSWMQYKGYLTKPLAYDEQTGAFALAEGAE